MLRSTFHDPKNRKDQNTVYRPSRIQPNNSKNESENEIKLCKAWR